MLTHFKIKCLIEIEGTIEIPTKGWFVINQNTIRLCCTKGSIIEYIHLVTPLQIAIFLLKHGIICHYAVMGELVTMYQNTIGYSVRKSDWNVSLQSKLLPVTIEDLHLTREAVRTIFAREALEKAAADSACALCRRSGQRPGSVPHRAVAAAGAAVEDSACWSARTAA